MAERLRGTDIPEPPHWLAESLAEYNALREFEGEVLSRLQATARPQIIWQSTPQPRPPLSDEIARARAEGRQSP
jgi:hypothetical protein